jgi:hypothetical protein
MVVAWQQFKLLHQQFHAFVHIQRHPLSITTAHEILQGREW